MKKKIVFTALLLCCFFAGFATIESLNGKWTGTLKTDGGDEYPLLYNFKIDGDELTGTAKTPKGLLPINVLINNMEIDHNGKFYGDSVGVDISLGDQKAHATLKKMDQ